MPKNDREILKADIEDGYTKIANLILEALALTNLNGKQMAICMFIMRRTYGWGITEDEITLEEIAQACNTDRPYASKMLKVLIDNKIIIRSNYMPGKTPNYGMNTRVAEWDKGCINVQQLQDYTIQGLYKYTTQGLHKYTTPEGTQDIEAQGPGTPPKERVKKGEINSGNTPPENGEKGEDEMPLLPEPIAKTLERYTPEQKEVVTQYWNCIRQTRRTGKLAESIIINHMDKWSKYPAQIVIDSMKLHITKYPYKREDYTGGIIRRMNEEKGRENGQAGGDHGENQRPGSTGDAAANKSNNGSGQAAGGIDRNRFKYKRQ